MSEEVTVIEAPADGVKPKRAYKKNRRPAATPHAMKQRARRKMQKMIEKIPPMPAGMTPAMLGDALHETALLLNQAISRVAMEGMGGAQEAKNLSLAAKACVANWDKLQGTITFNAKEVVCACARCAKHVTDASRDAMLVNYAEIAWRMVQLAKLALPKDRLAPIFPVIARDWVYSMSNCLDQLNTAGKKVASQMTAQQVYMHHHRHELANAWDKLVIAAAAVREQRGVPHPVVKSTNDPRLLLIDPDRYASMASYSSVPPIGDDEDDDTENIVVDELGY